MREERLNPLTFVHDWYMAEYLRITYSRTIIPINGEDMWGQAPRVDIKAPVFPIEKKDNLQFKRRSKPGEKMQNNLAKFLKVG